jgi:hypothetical protein
MIIAASNPRMTMPTQVITLVAAGFWTIRASLSIGLERRHPRVGCAAASRQFA